MSHISKMRRRPRHGKFIVTGELFDDPVNLLLSASPATVATLARMIAAMDGGEPPLCGACGAALTAAAPPGGYVVLRHCGSGEELLSGVCAGCLADDRPALQRRLATALGVEPLSVAHLHLGQWGRA